MTRERMPVDMVKIQLFHSYKRTRSTNALKNHGLVEKCPARKAQPRHTRVLCGTNHSGIRASGRAPATVERVRSTELEEVAGVPLGMSATARPGCVSRVRGKVVRLFTSKSAGAVCYSRRRVKNNQAIHANTRTWTRVGGAVQVCACVKSNINITHKPTTT